VPTISEAARIATQEFEVEKEGRRAMILILIPFAIITMILAYQGTFYTTGAQWYEACWARSVEVNQKNLLIKGPLTSDPYKAVIWANCETESLRGIYGSGMVFSPANDGNIANLALLESCPSADRMPIGGTYLLVLELLQKDGGPRLIDKFLPAEKTISATVNRRWPNCQHERDRQNLPRVIETASGRLKFDWQKSCYRCDERGLEVMQPL
jgi:hypothetical protein